MTLLAIPNISEGRDEKRIVRIARSPILLDTSADADHNRAVLTYGGDRSRVVEACIGMVGRAVSELDINRHSGVHPRFGVVDVLPLVAFGCSETDVRDAADEISWHIAEGPGVPVLRYGRASAAGTTLPDLRRMLRTAPPIPHPTAGVVCIGIRDHMIAFNVNVRVEAKALRSAVRALRALPGVRTLAFDLPSRGLGQLSMNLTAPADAGPREAFEVVTSLGLDVVDAEIVGLIQEQVLAGLGSIPLRRPARSYEQALGA